MRRFHLPDEQCTKCGAMVRPINMSEHNDKCGKTGTLVKCERCGKSVMDLELKRHNWKCRFNNSMTANCERCGKQIKSSYLKKHQKYKCRGKK